MFYNNNVMIISDKFTFCKNNIIIIQNYDHKENKRKYIKIPSAKLYLFETVEFGCEKIEIRYIPYCRPMPFNIQGLDSKVLQYSHGFLVLQ